MEGEDLQDVFTPGDQQERVQVEAFFFFSDWTRADPP
jgi:hypothetical protein